MRWRRRHHCGHPPALREFLQTAHDSVSMRLPPSRRARFTTHLLLWILTLAFVAVLSRALEPAWVPVFPINLSSDDRVAARRVLSARDVPHVSQPDGQILVHLNDRQKAQTVLPQAQVPPQPKEQESYGVRLSATEAAGRERSVSAALRNFANVVDAKVTVDSSRSCF